MSINDREISITRELVTPQIAEAWLQRNEANRPMRRTSVARMAEDMLMGFWVETNPQPIIFDQSSALIDGQHRLAAVVKSGRSVWFWIARNVPRTTQLVIDDHIKRQVHDFAKWEMPGHNVTSKHVAVCRVMMEGLPGARSIKPTRSVQYKFMREHFAAIEFSLGVFSKRVPNITQSTTLGVIARSYYTQDRDRIRRFAEVLESGQMADQTESAAASLGRWMLERRKAARSEIYGKIERALLSFLRGESLAKVYAAKEELFPLPGEVVDGGSDEPASDAAVDSGASHDSPTATSHIQTPLS